MKGKKKLRGTKARVQASKRRSAYFGALITVAILIFIVISGFFAYSFLNSSQNQTSSRPFQLKAAIVDQLSLTQPNRTFIQKATNTLKQAGYITDYYPGEQVNVEFYRNLPTHEYGLIILRVHSALQFGKYPPVVLFTSECFDPHKYLYEVLTDRLPEVGYYSPDPEQERPTYFAISPEFVRQSMKGEFRDTIIIMMGCNGLTYTEMSKAFTDKGAMAYMAWSEAVSASHTDQATTQLLKHLLIEKQTIEHAVAETMEEVRPGRADNSTLVYYPLEAGAYTIES